MSELTEVTRVERHVIKSNHRLFKTIDENTFLVKNLYNSATYVVRQVFITTSKLKNDNEVHQEQLDFLAKVNNYVDEYNVKRAGLLASRQANGRDLDKVFKPLAYFDADHRYPDYGFVDSLLQSSDDYKALPGQVAQQTLRLVHQNWTSFFKAAKDYGAAKDKYQI